MMKKPIFKFQSFQISRLKIYNICYITLIQMLYKKTTTVAHTHLMFTSSISPFLTLKRSFATKAPITFEKNEIRKIPLLQGSKS